MGPPSTFFTSRFKRRRVAGHTPLTSGEGKRALYHCNYCEKDISNCIRIKCAVCTDFDLCLECFSVGVELNEKGHKNSHEYRVMDNLSFPLFHPAWGADEELLLLESVDMFGLGNWSAVSEHVGSKTADACKQHYYDTYVNVDTFPHPKPAPEMENVDPADFFSSPKKFVELQRKFGKGSKGPTEEAKRIQDHAASCNTMVPLTDASGHVTHPQGTTESHQQEPTTTAEEQSDAAANQEPAERPVVSLKAPKLEILEGVKVQQTEPGGGSDVDMMPAESITAEQQCQQPGNGRPAKKVRAAKREPEAAVTSAAGAATEPAATKEGGAVAAPTAEPPTAPSATPLAVTSSKTLRTDNVIRPEAIQVNGTMVEITTFNSKRDEFEHEYDNEAEVPIAELEFRADDSEEEVAQKLHMLAIYNERLAERERVRQFVKEAGLLNVKKLQAADKKRTAAERDLYSQLRVFARYLPESQFNTLVEGMVIEHKLRGRIQELKEYRRNGIRTFADADEYDAARKRKLSDHRSRVAALMDKLSVSLPTDPASYAAMVKAVVDSLFGSQGELTKHLAKLKGAGALPDTKSQASGLVNWRAKRGVGLDISAMPGVGVLSRQERELCASARLLPAHYLLLKSHFMRESSAGRPITRNEARTYFRLEPNKALRIWDLLAAKKWIGDGSTAPPEDVEMQPEAVDQPTG